MVLTNGIRFFFVKHSSSNTLTHTCLPTCTQTHTHARTRLLSHRERYTIMMRRPLRPVPPPHICRTAIPIKITHTSANNNNNNKVSHAEACESLERAVRSSCTFRFFRVLLFSVLFSGFVFCFFFFLQSAFIAIRPICTNSRNVVVHIQ